MYLCPKGRPGTNNGEPYLIHTLLVCLVLLLRDEHPRLPCVLRHLHAMHTPWLAANNMMALPTQKWSLVHEQNNSVVQNQSVVLRQQEWYLQGAQHLMFCVVDQADIVRSRKNSPESLVLPQIKAAAKIPAASKRV